MESGAKGCEVVVSGKLRAARAKSMKFTVRSSSLFGFFISEIPASYLFPPFVLFCSAGTQIE